MSVLAAVATDIFASWLNAELGTSYSPHVDGVPDLLADSARRLAVSVQPLFEIDSDAGWARRCDAVATQLRSAGAAPLAVWLPPQTDLPHGDRTDFVRRISNAAADLPRGSRGQVEFPVTLLLKKLSDEASYVRVAGGLAPHWARLTGRAFGQYELDSSAIHRLPEPESRVAELLDWVVLLGNGMKAGAISELKAEDAWTLTRPAFGDATMLIAAPPESDPSNGTNVRRLLRRALRETAESHPAGATARALLFVGLFNSIEEESATIALRSCDPSLYTDLDAVCLIADGRCKPLYPLRRARLAG